MVNVGSTETFKIKTLEYFNKFCEPCSPQDFHLN